MPIHRKSFFEQSQLNNERRSIVRPARLTLGQIVFYSIGNLGFCAPHPSIAFVDSLKLQHNSQKV